jgi:hypothetical protein
MKILFGFMAVCLALWFVIFEWNFVRYPTDPAYGPFTCYSPNNGYYIERYQTPIEAIQDPLYAKGIAILYDKTGKELYRGYTSLADLFWFDDSAAFFGVGDWYVKLPSSPIDGSKLYNEEQGCWPKRS